MKIQSHKLREITVYRASVYVQRALSKEKSKRPASKMEKEFFSLIKVTGAPSALLS